MQKTGAKVIWASTTPIPDVPEKKYSARSIEERNAVAARVMARLGVETDDLCGAIQPRLAELRRPQDVHFFEPGNVFLGRQVAAFLLPRLSVQQ